MVVDNLDGLRNQQQYQADSTLERQISDFMSTVSQVQGDNKVLMTNQDEMTSIYNGRDDQAIVYGEITTNNGGSSGSNSVSGPEYISYIGQMIKEKIASTEVVYHQHGLLNLVGNQPAHL